MKSVKKLENKKKTGKRSGFSQAEQVLIFHTILFKMSEESDGKIVNIGFQYSLLQGCVKSKLKKFSLS